MQARKQQNTSDPPAEKPNKTTKARAHVTKPPTQPPDLPRPHPHDHVAASKAPKLSDTKAHSQPQTKASRHHHDQNPANLNKRRNSNKTNRPRTEQPSNEKDGNEAKKPRRPDHDTHHTNLQHGQQTPHTHSPENSRPNRNKNGPKAPMQQQDRSTQINTQPPHNIRKQIIKHEQRPHAPESPPNSHPPTRPTRKPPPKTPHQSNNRHRVGHEGNKACQKHSPHKEQMQNKNHATTHPQQPTKSAGMQHQEESADTSRQVADNLTAHDEKAKNDPHHATNHAEQGQRATAGATKHDQEKAKSHAEDEAIQNANNIREDHPHPA
ncbi:hypothetical protein SAMN03159300_10482 [Janthinobacterium sp. 344]|nr:hypothetical protein SAMN03159300_10482 [Janthinobacterium sp. 344]